MICELNRKNVRDFISFADKLYKQDKYYVPFMKGDLKKTLIRLVFEKKTYKALCSYDENGKINGRILLTVKKNKQLNTEHCGYFSHIEVVNDYDVFKTLMDEAVQVLKKMGAEYILGPFFPHDPDNRRGILIEGFDYSPMIFTSHNPEYYKELFEKYGFEKLTDAMEYAYVESPEIMKKVRETAEKAINENDIYITKANLKHPDKDIEDVHSIMEIASTSVNFETVISMQELTKIFKTWKVFMNPDYIFIARRKADDKPIGFTLSILDYNELIRKMKGKLNIRSLFIFLFEKKKIKGLRAILQYIIPEYQHKGVSKALYWETKKSVDKNHIERITLGTIMEKNNSSNGAILSLGGQLSRIYRVYYKPIQ